jgi:hypothetical protein
LEAAAVAIEGGRAISHSPTIAKYQSKVGRILAQGTEAPNRFERLLEGANDPPILAKGVDELWEGKVPPEVNLTDPNSPSDLLGENIDEFGSIQPDVSSQMLRDAIERQRGKETSRRRAESRLPSGEAESAF